MGACKWNGIPLYPGYPAHIGGKSVELDSQVPASQIPRITGSVSADSQYNDIEEVDDLSLVKQPSKSAVSKYAFGTDADSGLGAMAPADANSAGSTKKFVAPTNFYGKTADQPKSKGPLYVSLLRHFRLRLQIPGLIC